MTALGDALTPPAARILTIDIETSPNLGYVWSLWDQNISLSQLKDVGEVICWAAKWHGTSRAMFMSNHHDGHQAMIQGAWDLLDKADVVVTYNGNSFDIKHLHREFLLAELPAPTPAKSVDLLRMVKAQFKFQSHKLDHVADQLGVGTKVKHEGFALWLACLAGDDKAWARMKRYNVGDVRLTEALYDRLKGWMPTHPHLAHKASDVPTCNQCADGGNLERAGVYLAKQIRYLQYRCTVCGAIVRGTRHSRAAITHGVA